MNSRRFTSAQAEAVRLVSDQDGQLDHIIPYSAGGSTSVENCQILPNTMNQRKGSFEFKPRLWQREFLKLWEMRDHGAPFMLIAIPGSGKTMAALEAARRWMAAGADRRVVVVVPTDNLRNQWKEEAARFGIQLQSKEFGTNFKHGYQGAVTTYHTIGNRDLTFRKLCSVAPTMVIFDEIHHCGEDSHFGEGIKEAFTLAKEKLCMSGTPWKSDGKPIPFVRYDGDGYALGNYRYEYPHALRDEVVRYLVFDHAKGRLINDFSGEQTELSGETSESDAARRLKLLLDAEGEYVMQQLSDAHRKLQECRRTVPDAAGLAVCIDQLHALKVAKVLKQITGREPSVIVSDSDLENDSVESFRKAKTEWLVAVRKVSEGTDIKRLQVLCYLTNVTSELFFRQVIGRVSRVRNLEDYEGYVYLPADPRLIAAARNIENAQVLAIREEAEMEGKAREMPERQPTFETFTTRHDGTETVMIGNESVPVAEAREVERIAEATGLPMSKVREVLLMSGPVKTSTTFPQEAEAAPFNLEEQEKALRHKCNKLAFRLSHLLKVEVAEIHGKFKPQKQMTIAELEAKHRRLIEEIRKA